MISKTERQQQILELLRQQSRSTLDNISQSFGVSEITIRRDVKALEEIGAVQRFHGGVVTYIAQDEEAPVVKRQLINQNAKMRIAKEAATHVKNGDSIFLGSGSTTLFVAQHLKQHQNLTVTTNAITVVQELAMQPNITLIILGGMLRHSELSMIGHITEQALSEIRVDKVIVGMRGVDIGAGLTSDYLPEVMTDRAIMNMAAKVMLVADKSKLGHIASAFVAPVQRVTTLITDTGAPNHFVQSLRSQDIEVILA